MCVDIVIAEDHRALRSGLRSMLNAEPDLHVVGEAASGEEALEVVSQVHPQVLITDLTMPGPDGIELTRMLRRLMPETCVLILSIYDDASVIREALQAGACGYLPKLAAVDELVRAVRAVASGQKYRSRAARPKVPRVPAAPAENANQLDDDDRKLMRLIGSGYSNAQLMSELRLTQEELDTRKRRLYDRLGVRSRVELVRWLRERSFV